MATCDVCGNEYDKVFTIQHQDRTGTFDSFECAIAGMAPECAHCGVKIIGHGVLVTHVDRELNTVSIGTRSTPIAIINLPIDLIVLANKG